MRKVVWKNGDRQKISTGHPSFDNQTSGLATGNIIGGTQFGNYIRAHDTTVNPIGAPCPPGAMQKYDLSLFRDLPPEVQRYVEENGRSEMLNLHKFFHDRDGQTVVHGYVVTKGYAGLHELMQTFVTGPTEKSRGVISTAAEYVSNQKGTLARVNAIGALLEERMEDFLEQFPLQAREAFQEVLDVLSQHPGNITDGPRVIRHLAEKDYKVASRTDEGKEAADVVEAIAARSEVVRMGLAGVATQLCKEIEKQMGEDVRPDWSAVEIAIGALLQNHGLKNQPTPGYAGLGAQ